ncbi:MAG: hypothetical protein ACON4Z_14270 [Planctomycetota bacterium]
MIRATAVLSLLLVTACSSMRYDLDAVPCPVRADQGPAGGETFALKSKYVMYVHGLLGEKQPPVGDLVAAQCEGAKEVTDFRVSAGPNLWDWLGTHLSLGFVRLKTVNVTGTVHR